MQSDNGKWIHFLLTQRLFKDNEINIFEELNNIKNLGRKFYGKYPDPNPKFVILRKILKKTIKFILGVKFFNYLERNFKQKIKNYFWN